MWGLIKNEFLKLGRKSKLYIVIGFLVIATIIQCYGEYNKITAKAPEKIIKECEQLIWNMENMVVIQSGGSEGDRVNINDNIEKHIADTIEDAKKDIERAQRKLNNMERDWRENAKEEIQYLETSKEEAITEGNVAEQELINTKIKILKYHLDNDMKPDDEYIMKSTVIIDTITYLGSVFLAIVVIILTVDTIAAENSPATIKILLTKPVSRGRIYISKFLASLISSWGIVMVIEVLTFLVIGIIFGFGNMQAPTEIGPDYMPDPIQIARHGMGVQPVLNSTILIPLWQKLAIMLLLQTIFIMTVVSFGMFISAIMKNGISAIILGLLVTAMLTVITVQISDFGSFKASSVIMPYLFSTYSAGGLILNGFLSSALSSTLISLPFAILVMTSWAVLFYLLGYKVFAKKEVLV